MKFSKKQSGSTAIIIAIVLAGFIIAGAILSSGRIDGKNIKETATAKNSAQERGEPRKISNEDHILGEPNAPITIIEYSDLECPFCKRLHPILNRVVQENNDVRWVYRHFPLSSIHSRAQGAAIASECVAKIGGNGLFWEFINTIFENQKKLGESLYKETARSYNINESAFESCLKDKSVVNRVNDDLLEATSVGGRGTPYVVVLPKNGNIISFSGALPYESVMSVIQRAR